MSGHAIRHRNGHWSQPQKAAASPTQRGDIRIGDAERQATLAQLSRHYADGRITLVELEQRQDQVTAAMVAADLHDALRDLPRITSAAESRQDRLARLRGIAVVALILTGLVVLVATTGLRIWPLMAMFWWFGLPAIRRAQRHSAHG